MNLLNMQIHYDGYCYNIGMYICTVHMYHDLGNFHVKNIHVINFHFRGSKGPTKIF